MFSSFLNFVEIKWKDSQRGISFEMLSGLPGFIFVASSMEVKIILCGI